LLVDVDDLIRITSKHIIGWGHTDQMRKLSAANASGQSSDLTGGHCAQDLTGALYAQDLTGAHCAQDLTGGHCAQQGRPSGLAPAQPRRSSQRVL